jgi:hypothetical protein
MSSLVSKNLGKKVGLVYASYLGESGFERGSGTAVDAHSQAYVIGETESEDFPARILSSQLLVVLRMP